MNKVITVHSLSHGRLYVELADGQSGEFDMTPYMEREKRGQGMGSGLAIMHSNKLNYTPGVI
jgi:hypothetical protein